MTRVLIVDDKEENLYYLQALLNGNGCEVRSARHGAEAMVMARQLPPDIVVSDLLMPVMDGYTLLRHWKADARLKKIPFIVYTATYTEPEDERLALSLGADAFILKPSEPEVFLERFRAVQANATAAVPGSPRNPTGDENDLLKVYSETLIRKLEEKTLQLEEANHALQEDIAVRTQAEETLRRSQTLLRMAGRISRMGAWSVKLPEFKLTLSDEACAIHDMPPDFAPTVEEATEFYAPEYREVITRAYEECVHAGTPFDVELQIITARGRRVWVRAIGEAERDVSGIIQRVQGAIQDISDRKEAVEQTRQLAERLVTTLESITDAFLTVDQEWRFSFLNREAERLLMRNGRALIGCNIWTEFPEAVGSTFEREYRRAMEGRQTVEFEEFFPPLNAWFSVRAYPSEQGLAIYFRDVSAARQADEALRASEERFRELAENINEVFWISDVQKQQIVYVSPAYEKIWGQPCEALREDARAWLDAIHPDDRQRVEQAMQRQTEGTYDEEYRIVRPDKSIRWIHDGAFPVRNQAGEAERIVGVARDITDNRKLEEQFRQAQKMEAIGQLASGVAHDFNNVLAVISMQAGLLAYDKELSPAQAELACEIESAVQRAADLTRQLLMFSRRQTMQPRDLDLNIVISNISKMLQRILGEQIQMQFKIARQPLYVNADAGMMDQVLMNFTVNARDAMPNGGRLIIETSPVEFDGIDEARSPQVRPGLFVCLKVSDTGCGIAPENLTRIFEPFFTTKEVGKGTGLGLATVFGIVHQHQGWINVESEAGNGTVFRVYIPRIARGDEKASSLQMPPLASGGNETLLVVEDDPSLRGKVRTALTRLGYRVLEASSGAGALEAWKQNRDEIRLLLTDLVLPEGMNGKELARRLLEAKPGLKIIYTSGYSAEVAGKDLRLEEGVNFLSKPFQAHKLAQTVRVILDS